MSSVSVIIPTWNRASTIEAAIKSVLNQTVSVTEILVCDDGSDDNTKEIVCAIQKTHPIVKWIVGPRAGLPAVPRNRGLKVSVGEWIAFLDSDDEWLPQKIEKQLAHLVATGCKASCTNAYRYVSGNTNAGQYADLKTDKIFFKQLLYSNSVICSSAIIHRSLLSVVNGFLEDEKLKAIEDYSFWLKLATQTDFAYINEPCINYFDIPEQSIRKNGDVNVQKKIILTELSFWIECHKGLIKKEHLQAIHEELEHIEYLGKSKTGKLLKRISTKFNKIFFSNT